MSDTYKNQITARVDDKRHSLPVLHCLLVLLFTAMMYVMQGLLKMERSLFFLLIVFSFGVRIQGDSRGFPTSFWCDIKCHDTLGGCLGTEGRCKGVCYCVAVSYLRYKTRLNNYTNAHFMIG